MAFQYSRVDFLTKNVSKLFQTLNRESALQGDCVGLELDDDVTLAPQATSIGQCVLRVNSPVFELSNVSSELLLSDVYVRMERTAAEQENFVPLMTVTSGSAWLIGSVFRGDKTNCRAIDLGRGQKLHARSTALSSTRSASQFSELCLMMLRSIHVDAIENAVVLQARVESYA